MQRTILFFLALIIPILTFSQSEDTEHINENYTFKTGVPKVLFGNHVKLRAQPNTTAEVLAVLNIGEKITIISKTENFMEFEGLESPWYKVKSKGKTGYLLGAFISYDTLSSGNTNFYFVLKKEKNQLHIKIRSHRNGDKKYAELIFKLQGQNFYVRISDNKGLSGITNIITIEYPAEACGVLGGRTHLFWDGKQIHHIADLAEFSEAGLFYNSESFTFPNEENGVPNKIIYTNKSGETIDDETNWTKTITETKELSWNQDKLTPALRESNNN